MSRITNVVRDRVIVLATSLAIALCLTGCEKAPSTGEASKASKSTSEAAAPKRHKLETDEPIDLLDPDGSPANISLQAPRKLPPCHKLFEPESKVVPRFPASDPVERAALLAGCDPEAYRRTDEYTFIAYRVPRKKEGWQQRFVAYDADGKLVWEYLIDRSENASNFRANFRRGLIAPLLPRLACAGTLWEGGTRLTCLNMESGAAEFDGMLKFWAGMVPRASDTSLVTATISGLTRRYPYSGVEMRFKDLPGSGGRAAFYATDGQRLFFAPSDGDVTELTAIAFDGFETTWISELPAKPKPHYDDATFPQHSLLLLKSGDSLVALDTSTGKSMWAANVGDDTPPVVAGTDEIYMLVRRDTENNLLYSLSPRTAKINWWTKVPPGTLELRMYDGHLFTRSVRAVRQVDLPGQPETTDGPGSADEGR